MTRTNVQHETGKLNFTFEGVVFVSHGIASRLKHEDIQAIMEDIRASVGKRGVLGRSQTYDNGHGDLICVIDASCDKCDEDFMYRHVLITLPEEL